LFIFHFIYGIILPIDELIFFRGVGIPPTSIRSEPVIKVLPTSHPLSDKLADGSTVEPSIFTSPKMAIVGKI